MDRHTQAYVYATAAVLLWATVASAFKLTLRYLDVCQMLFYASVASTALLFVILWPLRRMMRRRRETAERQSRPDDTAPGAEPHDRSKSSHHS